MIEAEIIIGRAVGRMEHDHQRRAVAHDLGRDEIERVVELLVRAVLARGMEGPFIADRRRITPRGDVTVLVMLDRAAVEGLGDRAGGVRASAASRARVGSGRRRRECWRGKAGGGAACACTRLNPVASRSSRGYHGGRQTAVIDRRPAIGRSAARAIRTRPRLPSPWPCRVDGLGLLHHRLDEDFLDVGEADEAEDLLQVLALRVVTFRAGARAVGAAAGVDGDERLARDEARVAGVGRKAEGQAGLHEHVDVVLELVGNAEIPHRQGDHIFIRRLEMFRERDDRFPRGVLFRREFWPCMIAYLPLIAAPWNSGIRVVQRSSVSIWSPGFFSW